VDEGDLVRPDGASEAVGVALRGDLADGSYTATFRVVSAESHPVSGGYVFTVSCGSRSRPACRASPPACTRSGT
jgi:copper transport protein